MNLGNNNFGVITNVKLNLYMCSYIIYIYISFFRNATLQLIFKKLIEK